MPFDPADIVCVIFFVCSANGTSVRLLRKKIAEQKDLHVTSCNAMKRLLCVYCVTQWIQLRSVSHNLSDGRML